MTEMPQTVDLFSLILRLLATYLAIAELRRASMDFCRVKDQGINGVRKLLSLERIIVSSLFALAQLVLMFSVSRIIVLYPEHGETVSASMMAGNVVAAILMSKAMISRKVFKYVDIDNKKRRAKWIDEHPDGEEYPHE